MRFYCIVLGAGLCVPQTVQAAEWATSASINQYFSYNDNVRMLKKKQGSFIYGLTPVLNARYTTPNSEIAASASYGIQRYAAIPEFNQDNQNYSLSGNYQTERMTYTLETSYSKTPVRNFADETGINNTAADAIRWSVDPAVTYRIAPKDNLNIQASYSEQIYSTNEIADNRFANNQNALIDLGWTRQWSERYMGGVSLIYYRYQSDPSLLLGITNNIVSNSYGINFLSNYLISDKWQINISLGYRYTDTKNNISVDEAPGEPINEALHGFITDSSLSYKGEVLSVSVNISQTLLPSGLGQLNQQSGVGVEFSYQLTERLSTMFSANYVYRKPISGLRRLAGSERQNITVTPSINYQITPDWIVSASYSYRYQNRSLNQDLIFEQEQNFQGFVADSNTVMLTLRYNWSGLSLSR